MPLADLPPTGLVDREVERGVLDRLVAGILAGQSRVLVLRGEAGVGKSALLGYLTQAASACRIARAEGVESEMELAFAGLHALCAPMLGGLERLPAPQHDALCTAFGLSAGPPPDRFLVGLAVLSLLADAAEEQPVLCVVDDAQWLDRVSAQTLAFVARRLLAERVGIVFARRDDNDERALDGLPELVVTGLRDDDASALLDAQIPGPLDGRVRDRILAEAAGNPLALLELPRAQTLADMAGGFGLPGEGRLASRLEGRFARQVEVLPDETRRLLLLAAAEPVGDVTLLWRAAERLGIGPDAVGPAQAAGLFDLGARVRFRHPLVRGAAYRTAGAHDRRQAHEVLAEATDPQLDPDRRAWHRARATAVPDEAVAAELEASAGRAQARGGMAAAAAFLEQAAVLTPDPARRGTRSLAAAEAMLAAGAFEEARALLATAEAAPLDELALARIDLLRAQIAFAAQHGSEAAVLLLAAARRLEPLDLALARETYLEAFGAARVAGRERALLVAEVVRAGRLVPVEPDDARLADGFLDGLTSLYLDGYAAAVPIRREALRGFQARELTVAEGLRWLWLAALEAAELWDVDGWSALSARHVELARAAGALSVLPPTLHADAVAHVLRGELDAAASLVAEVHAVQQATGTVLGPFAEVALAAWQGRDQELVALADATLVAAAEPGGSAAVLVALWARAILANARGRYDEALSVARAAAEHPYAPGPAQWSLSEVVEAATRSGQEALAADACAELAGYAQAAGTDWALGLSARALALVGDGDAAERGHREAIERLGRTSLRGELARSHLLYGEWLRRSGRREDARVELRAAHAAFTEMGAHAFAERAARELAATGETVRRLTPQNRDALTPQEAQIARLAADGHTNGEIGTRLFISPRTVEYHLRKVFTKLDISSRRDLADSLPR
jgi:DNA-binding CsgD family transcriptional regulator